MAKQDTSPQPLLWFSSNHTWSRGLLELRPHEAEEALIRFKISNPGLDPLEFLLQQLEKEAKDILDADPPVGDTSADLAPKQEYALATLRHCEKLRTLYRSFSVSDSEIILQTSTFIKSPNLGLSEEHRRTLSQKEVARELALESIRLALASIGGDFWTNLWPKTDMGIKVSLDRERMKAAGVKARRRMQDRRWKYLQANGPKFLDETRKKTGSANYEAAADKICAANDAAQIFPRVKATTIAKNLRELFPE